jgi:type IX secretion system PorP/SprF family membrane protein
LLVLTSHAQQDPMYTQYMNQILSINPAYAGAKGVTSITLINREQWVSWPGNPVTRTMFVHSPINTEMGVGGSLVYDTQGITDDRGRITNWGLFGDYSYTISFTRERYLSFGLKAGLSFYNAQLSGLNLGENSEYDPAFRDAKTKPMPNAGVGVYFSSPTYYVGFSVPKLISNKMLPDDIETGTVIREELHAFFIGGYVWDINRILKFKPYFMVRAAMNAPLSADVTAQFVFFEKFFIGGTYRLGNAVGLMLQAQVTQQLKIGYAYDLTTTEMRPYNNGTHEIFINFDFSFGRGRVRSPRYF